MVARLRTREGLAAAAIALVALVVLLVVFLGREGGSHGRSNPPSARIFARTQIEPRALMFAEPIDARLDVVVDKKRVDPGTVKAHVKVAPYEPYAPVRVTRHDVGRRVYFHYDFRLRCLAQICVPQQSQLRFNFDAVRVTGKTVAGRTISTRTKWPGVQVFARLDPRDILQAGPLDRPPWRADVSKLPPVSYSMSPGALGWLLAAAALLLLGGGGALVWRWWALRPRPEPVEAPIGIDVPPLERALLLLERSRAKDAVEQRKALELLSEELDRAEEFGLAAEARELAWSPRDPSPDRIGALAARVRELVDELARAAEEAERAQAEHEEEVPV